MQPLSDFKNSLVRVLFTDIDDTLTDHGVLRPEAYAALWKLAESGLRVIPVTGRPAGWCEMIARFWPVHGVVGENGGLYFRYNNRQMLRHFAHPPEEQAIFRGQLDRIRDEVLSDVPGAAVASDQFCRLMDLAIDFAEDVGPLPSASIEKILEIFHKHGAQAKVSSIHVNGWFGTYDKLSMCRIYAHRELACDLDVSHAEFAFAGDSPNDEPMFAFFKNSFAVANFAKFKDRVRSLPTYLATGEGGAGFVQIADCLIAAAKIPAKG